MILRLRLEFPIFYKKKTPIMPMMMIMFFFHVHVSVEFTNILLISEPDHYAQTGPVFNKS